MLKYTLPVLLSVMVGCTSTPQRSGSAESYYFDCDTPPGKFSEWNRTMAATTIHASGTIELVEPRQDPRWVPAASVWFVGSNESAKTGIQVFVTADSPDDLHVRLIRSPVDAQVIASLKRTDGPIPFSLSLDGSHMLSATIAGKTQSFPVTPFAVAKFSLTCSTGDFHFKEITVVAGGR